MDESTRQTRVSATDRVIVELKRFPDEPLRTTETVRLGEDRHGVWLGADRYVFLIPHDGWWKARHFPDGGWKIDIATPAVWSDDRVELADLALDVRRHHWQSWVEDRHEFQQLVSDGVIPPGVADEALRAVDEIVERLWDEPFRTIGDRWLSCLPGPFEHALLLDMGGVLQRAVSGKAAARWEHDLRLPSGAIAKATREAIGPGWEGDRSPEEISWRIRAALGIDHGTYRRLRSDLASEGGLDHDLVALLRSRPPSVAAAVVSNNGADIRPVWEEAFGINDLVDLVVISGEERVAKPDPALLEIAAARLGVVPSACVFLDDKLENVEAASAFGMRAHQHTADRPAVEQARQSLGL